MVAFIDLVGVRFGMLVVIKRSVDRKVVYWDCICDCGGTVSTRACRLKMGMTKSCGCLKRKTKLGYKLEDHEFYETWRNMNKRARKRGISVGFENMDDAYNYMLSIGWKSGLAVCRGTKDKPDCGNYEVGNIYIDTRGNNVRDYIYKVKNLKNI